MTKPLIIPGIDAHELQHSQILGQPMAAARWGIMHHYDDSSSDEWSLKWFQDPACTNGYTWIVMDDGKIVELVDPALRSPHAGKCKTANANSVFYGICLATNGRTPATTEQFETLVKMDVALFRYHHWPFVDVAKRIRGHHEERIYTERDTPKKELWGKLGAKVDPIGINKAKPVLDLDRLRVEVSRQLTSRAA